MNKMIVTVFNNEKSAYEGLTAIKQLHTEGSLTLYAAAVIAKDRKGVVSVKQADEPGPAGTIFGLAAGSLVGLLGGPVGLAVGAATGTFAGRFRSGDARSRRRLHGRGLAEPDARQGGRGCRR